MVHIIVDYTFLYYKYKFQLDSGKMPRLTKAMNWKGSVIEKDISQIYYSMREIETFRREWENQGYQTMVTVCFDMPSKRKQADTEEADKYKSNRGHKLGEEDFDNIQFVEKTLKTAGYNTYRIEGYEADDLVNHIVHRFHEKFEFNVIYTPDADLLVNIMGNVAAKRYKSRGGYSAVTKENFTDYLEKEMKARIPFNAIMLYKATVGDKSDCIDGIKKFGPAAFTKMVDYLNEKGVNWNECGNYEATKDLLKKCEGYLKTEQLEQAYESLDLVKPEIIPDELIAEPTSISNREKREAAYMPYDMKSLVG